VAVAAAAAVGSVALGGTAAGATGSADHQEDRPTVVLEHGAFADASSWNGVIERLHMEGYPVVAAANPLRGPSEDAAALRSVIDHVQGPVILVGHSYGGSVISEAATGEPRVKALVHVAAFLPAPGENALGLTGLFPGSTLADTLDPVPFPSPTAARAPTSTSSRTRSTTTSPPTCPTTPPP
jgi:pimeloyl-ACP methyl ester carboxylesterase